MLYQVSRLLGGEEIPLCVRRGIRAAAAAIEKDRQLGYPYSGYIFRLIDDDGRSPCLGCWLNDKGGATCGRLCEEYERWKAERMVEENE